MLLLATCTVRSGSALIPAVRFVGRHSRNNLGHWCNLAGDLAVERKKKKSKGVFDGQKHGASSRKPAKTVLEQNADKIQLLRRPGWRPAGICSQ